MVKTKNLCEIVYTTLLYASTHKKHAVSMMHDIKRSTAYNMYWYLIYSALDCGYVCGAGSHFTCDCGMEYVFYSFNMLCVFRHAKNSIMHEFA